MYTRTRARALVITRPDDRPALLIIALWLAVAVMTALLVFASAALAQTTTPATPDGQNRGALTAPGGTPDSGAGASGSGTSGSAGLGAGRGTGVIQPPSSVDPGMTRTPPATEQSQMPIVKPPGTPGGNPRVIPK